MFEPDRPEVPGETSEDTQPVRIQHALPLNLPVVIIILGAGLSLALLGAVALFLLVQPAPFTVTLRLNGSDTTVETTAPTVRSLLAEQAVLVDATTMVTPALDTSLSPQMLVIVSTARSVTLTVNGLTSVFRTTLENPADILNGAGVALRAEDVVFVDGTRITVHQLANWPLPANRITITGAVPVTIVTDEGQTVVHTTAATVGDALVEADIVMYLGDEITPDLSAEVQPDMEIRITRSVPVTIAADGIRTETRVRGATVGDALAESGMMLGGLDYTLPPETTLLIPEMTVRVVRVTEQILTEQSPVPFETIYQADAQRALDEVVTLQQGVEGIDQRAVRIRYEDGIESSRLDEGVARVQEPVHRVIAYGTQVVLRDVQTPDGPRQYWRTLRMYATSYHPAALGGDDITATGRRLTKGVVAIDPRVIAYGTEVYVEGYGVGIAADTGGPRTTPYWIDLGYEDSNYEHWSGWVEVYVLATVPQNIDYLLP